MPRFAAPRAALLPALQNADAGHLSRILAEGGASLETLILHNELGPLWHSRTGAAAFARSRTNAAMLFMRQVGAQQSLDDTLAQAGVTYAIFKGAGTRERLYDDASVRVCFDIDVLVAPDQRTAAARALANAGYQLQVDPALASHEVTLKQDAVAIDLHWDLLRPGRLPASLTRQMLDRRRRQGRWWVLDDTDALFVQLVHPAFSKHLSTTQMGLHRVADLLLWLQRVDVNWASLLTQLDACGVKTAAWAMLSQVALLAPGPFDPATTRAIEALRPGPVRAAYLAGWLRQDMSARFAHLHALRLLGLSLTLHDRPAGAWRALLGWHRSRQSATQNAVVLEGLSE